MYARAWWGRAVVAERGGVGAGTVGGHRGGGRSDAAGGRYHPPPAGEVREGYQINSLAVPNCHVRTLSSVQTGDSNVMSYLIAVVLFNFTV